LAVFAVYRKLGTGNCFWGAEEIPFMTGETSRETSGNRIKKRVWIKASAEVVYSALTESKELARWFCDRASCDPREGGELLAYWKTGKSIQKGRAVFTHLVPGRSMELLWIDDGHGTDTTNPDHTLSYDIKSKSGMTELVMTDSGDAPSDDETYGFLDQGWNSVLLELKDYCERRQRSARSRPRERRIT
jgi:uncharacterized protein YndB with AHSA1/START domain